MCSGFTPTHRFFKLSLRVTVGTEGRKDGNVLFNDRTELYLHSGRNLRHMRIFTMNISYTYL